MFSYKIVDLPRIAIIGKEGLCTKEKNVVQDLWQQVHSNFSDVADLGMKNADGSFVGFWGAMSDETMFFCHGRTVSPGDCIWQELKYMRIRPFRTDG